MGKVGIIKEKASANQQITGLLFNKEILPEFAYYWFVKNYSDIRGLTPATTLPILNQKKIKELIFHYPSIKEQQKIVSYLDSLKEKINILRQEQISSEAEINALMPSVLSKAFSGQ